MSSPVTDPHALRLLRSMMGGDLPVISPRIGYNVTYPRVEEVARVTADRAQDLLRELTEQGYLNRNFSTIVYRCPFDNTTSIRPRLICPVCQSEDIERVPLIEHMICGHVDQEKNFVKGEALLCPSCGKTLNQIGVDYRRPGHAYYSPTCGEYSPSPIEKWSCNAENHIFEIEEAVAEKLYTYTLNEAKRDEIQKVFGFIEPVKEAYVRCGYEAETFKMVTGKSGVAHLVDVYAKKGDENPVTSIARILTDKGITSEEVLKHFAITLDVDVTKPILIVSPQLDKESEVYTDQLKLKVIEGSNFKTIIEELEAIVCEQ